MDPAHAESLKDHLIWFNEKGKLTPCGEKALAFIKSAPKHGLDASIYEKILHITEGTSTVDAEHMMTKAMEQFARDLTGGAERDLFAQKHPSLTLILSVSDIIKKGITSAKDCTLLTYFMPHHVLYKNLQKALAIYSDYAKKARQEGDPAFNLTQTLKKGSMGKDVLSLRRYLEFYNYLTPSESTNSSLFDDNVEKAVKDFQAHHGEEADGVIGPKTQKLFSRTAEDYLKIIRLNLQRWRYLSPLEDKCIIVNVAGYWVSCLEKGHQELWMKAVVGMPSRKTPLFKAPLTHFIFNPTWTVPDGIFYKDKLPRILQDPDYLDRMSVFMRDHEGMPIDPSTVDWYHDRPRLTYPPGRSNPLGQIKFQIQNPYTIYLHDTNQKELFKKNRRALSSGCVRLEKPMELVAWLSHGEKYGTVEEVKQALAASHATSWHTLEHPVPVYIVYITAWMGDDGTVYFSDPYDEDKTALKNFS